MGRTMIVGLALLAAVIVVAEISPDVSAQGMKGLKVASDQTATGFAARSSTSNTSRPRAAAH